MLEECFLLWFMVHDESTHISQLPVSARIATVKNRAQSDCSGLVCRRSNDHRTGACCVLLVHAISDRQNVCPAAACPAHDGGYLCPQFLRHRAERLMKTAPGQ